MHVLSLRLKLQYLSALPYFKLTLLANGADVCTMSVMYVQLKKRRYLDKCRLSAPADSTGARDVIIYINLYLVNCAAWPATFLASLSYLHLWNRKYEIVIAYSPKS